MITLLDVVDEHLLRFNSLFVGMSFAIQNSYGGYGQGHKFQFPFRRDELCNSPSKEPNWLKPYAWMVLLIGVISPAY